MRLHITNALLLQPPSMPHFRLPVFVISCLLLLLAGSCANIVPPSGGERDTTPPVLLSISPADSQLNTRATKIELRFDEYVTVEDAAGQILVSPIMPFPITATGNGKKVTLEIPDSLLLANTTYRITLGNAIRDLHEGNAFAAYAYTFSTGSYFDSLALGGVVLDAETGLPDTGATVLLYPAQFGDSAINQRKPLYAMHVTAGGNFSFTGLPTATFRIYALRDKNNNLIYNGGDEWIAFLDTLLTTRPDSTPQILLRTFPEKDSNSTPPPAPTTNLKGRGGNTTTSTNTTADGKPGSIGYRLQADTLDPAKRTQDINQPLAITFTTMPASWEAEKVFVSVDSAGITTEVPVSITADSLKKQLFLNLAWREDRLYTIRLQKGFAKDTAGEDYLPGKYTFRSKKADEYAKLRIHIPPPYQGAGNVLQVLADTGVIYQKQVTDTIITLSLLAPGSYRMRMILDKNQNGKWDPGNLDLRLQPEIVIPFAEDGKTLKAGWDNLVDFISPE